MGSSTLDRIEKFLSWFFVCWKFFTFVRPFDIFHVSKNFINILWKEFHFIFFKYFTWEDSSCICILFSFLFLKQQKGNSRFFWAELRFVRCIDLGVGLGLKNPFWKVFSKLKVIFLQNGPLDFFHLDYKWKFVIWNRSDFIKLPQCEYVSSEARVNCVEK